MADTAEKKKPLDKLEDETVQKLDLIIRGLELGKFDETAKKVEFLGKLAGDESPQYIAKLLDRISDLEYKNTTMTTDVINLQMKVAQLETDKIGLGNQIATIEVELITVAKGLQYLFSPDPLGNNYELTEIQSFISSKGCRKF